MYRTRDENNEVGVCTECGSEQPLRYMEQQIKAGFSEPPCKLCGGVVKITKAENISHMQAVEDRRRGIVKQDDEPKL
jgi:hypothetical protein